ncbi:RNA polymerase sigma factor [Aestuariibaculum sediminum]|uniref:RNA polymerase sigma-70 factor n=1 Tax=Aestuariibaculum sediminum TaxID=2770637 RepID=A0A8J6PZU0_9FLAO|nr:RNA polymerase sigma-70 factor [Aestuariibaculum sediminum]MBD0832568.1 RNA polymerase sigma-70 factor [Aestuariibaculum sediminum]
MNNQDHKLLNALKHNHESAFNSIYSIYYRDLVVYCYNLCKRQDIAEDIVQAVLINLWEKRANLKVGISLKAYLYKAVYNKFASDLRKKKIKETSFEDLRHQIVNEVSQEKDDIMAQRMSVLNQAIDELPEKCKKVFLMSKVLGYRHKEIAKSLNISEKTVEKHITKGFMLIKKYVFNPRHVVKILFFYKNRLFGIRN